MELKVLHSLSDNYLYVLHTNPITTDTNQLAKPLLEKVVVVDPGSYKDSELQAFLSKYQIHHLNVLITHPHWDHVNGLKDLHHDFPNLKVYTTVEIFKDMAGGGLTEQVLQAIPATGEFTIVNEPFKVLDTPGHTAHSITYFYKDYMFAGDLLFSCGCGRVFTGTYQQMYNSIQAVKEFCEQQAQQQQIHYQMCVAHEYTLSNIKFARSLKDVKINEHLDALEQRVKRTLEAGHDYTPVLFSEELTYNPFVRAQSEAEFTQIRKAKDNF